MINNYLNMRSSGSLTMVLLLIILSVFGCRPTGSEIEDEQNNPLANSIIIVNKLTDPLEYSSRIFYTRDSSVSVTASEFTGKKSYRIQTKYGDVVTMIYQDDTIKTIHYLEKATTIPASLTDHTPCRYITSRNYSEVIPGQHVFAFTENGYVLKTNKHTLNFSNKGWVDSINVRQQHPAHDSVMIFESPTSFKWVTRLRNPDH